MEIITRKRIPSPRAKVYELYWRFAARRQEAFERRLAGEPGPWTSDRILQEFKFCNVYRAADRVSQYMIKDVVYRKPAESEDDRLFQIVAFRTFSKMETWEGLIERLGRAPTIRDLESGKFEAALDDIKRVQGVLYTGAFILCANKAFGHDEKHKNHVALFKEMFIKQKAREHLRKAKSLRAIVEYLEKFPLMGPFMSYQTAIDLNYSDIINFSENETTQAGPGALRGLKKIFTNLGEYSPAETILWMVENQEREFARLGLKFNGLWGRPLHAIDCQGLFCEVDKYCRQAVPELASNRKRIKAKFAPSGKPIKYFFPPKWGLRV